MGSIKITDNSPGFIPISITETADQTKAGSDAASANPEFQKVLRDLLNKLSDQKVDNESPTGLDTLATMMGNLKDKNPIALSQLLQTGLLSADAAGDSDPLTDFANAQMIAQYKVAMANFQKAMKMSPEDLRSLDLSTLEQISGNARARNGLAPDTIAKTPETVLPGVAPTKQQVAEYIIGECREIGIPEQLGLATAATESEMTQFNKDGNPFRHSNSDSTDWGIMQVNDKAWGDQYDLNLLKTDWQYNVKAGLQILKHSYDAALKNSEGMKGPGDPNQNLARAAYSGYNAGAGNIWRYRTPVQDASRTGLYDVIDHEGFDMRDIRFWDNYRKFS